MEQIEVKVYFNTNIYCRPFDDLTQQRIFNEATASLNLFLLSSSGIIKIISSEIVLTEIFLIASLAKRDAVELLLSNNIVECITVTSESDNLATQISAKCKINDYADCLHLSLACLSTCDYFVTCDDEIFNKSATIEAYLKEMEYTLKIRNPIKFLNELEVK